MQPPLFRARRGDFHIFSSRIAMAAAQAIVEVCKLAFQQLRVLGTEASASSSVLGGQPGSGGEPPGSGGGLLASGRSMPPTLLHPLSMAPPTHTLPWQLVAACTCSEGKNQVGKPPMKPNLQIWINTTGTLWSMVVSSQGHSCVREGGAAHELVHDEGETFP